MAAQVTNKALKRSTYYLVRLEHFSKMTPADQHLDLECIDALLRTELIFWDGVVPAAPVAGAPLTKHIHILCGLDMHYTHMRELYKCVVIGVGAQPSPLLIAHLTDLFREMERILWQAVPGMF